MSGENKSNQSQKIQIFKIQRQNSIPINIFKKLSKKFSYNEKIEDFIIDKLLIEGITIKEGIMHNLYLSNQFSKPIIRFPGKNLIYFSFKCQIRNLAKIEKSEISLSYFIDQMRKISTYKKR